MFILKLLDAASTYYIQHSLQRKNFFLRLKTKSSKYYYIVKSRRVQCLIKYPYLRCGSINKFAIKSELFFD